MNKDMVINIINKVLRDNFDYVSLDTTLKVTDDLIEQGLLKVDEENNLKVCEHCLAAIESREGSLPYITIHVDLEDDKGKCEWCEQDGFDILYELI